MEQTLGSRISALRKSKGVTQDQLAEAMGVSPQAVSKWENDISCPDISMLPQLADYFQVSIDEMLRGERAFVPQVLPEEKRKPLEQMLLKIRVVDGEDKINVNLPMGLVKVGLQMDAMTKLTGDAVKEIDFDAILRMAEQGAVGKLVEMDSEGTKVEITIE